MDGNILFSRTTWTKKKYKSGDKFTSNQADYFIKDDYLFITTNFEDTDLLRYISLSGIFEDPLAVELVDTCEDKCPNPPEISFPIDGHLMDAVLQLAAQELIQVFKSMPVDEINDARDAVVIPQQAAAQQPRQ